MFNARGCLCLLCGTSRFYCLWQSRLDLRFEGKPAHWPVDHYFQEGVRHARFLGEDVTKYHKTLTTYVNGLIKAGFCITHLVEPQPDESMLDTVPEMRDELRRPMMLLIAARKN